MSFKFGVWFTNFRANLTHVSIAKGFWTFSLAGICLREWTLERVRGQTWLVWLKTSESTLVVVSIGLDTRINVVL